MAKKRIDENTVSISQYNDKMGPVHSVSLSPVKTCPGCMHCTTPEGKRICYAEAMYKNGSKPNIRAAWDRNLAILNRDRDSYFQQIRDDAVMQRFFRFHVSGDIIDADYLDRMCKLARDLKHTEFLAFTKSYAIVNDYFDTHKKPRNLHLIMSLPFTGVKIDNRHNLPTAAVVLKGQDPDPSWKVCGGKCSSCACRGVGCWQLKNGETICFDQH